jgi:hypothetical protein
VSRICVVTSKSRTYYALVSRLRRAGLPFGSLLPDSGVEDCDLVLTSAEEAMKFGEKTFALEDLDENVGIFKGQVVSRLQGPYDVLLIGVDPGKRTGLAVFYGRTRLALSTFDSLPALCSRVGEFARRIPANGVLVRIGNGNKATAFRLAESISKEVPHATIEVVDESGTSARGHRMKGVQKDAGSAAKIAFRRGEVVNYGGPRNRR